jgi:ABC-2 type transport system permease protein
LIIAGFFSGQATRFLETQFASETKIVGLVDESQLFTPIPAEFAQRYIVYPDEDAAKRALLANQIGVFVVIPRDYLETGKVASYARGSFTSISVESATLRTFLVSGLLAGKVDDATLQRASRPLDLVPVTLDASGKPSTEGPFASIAGFLVPYFLSIFLIVSIFVSSSYLLRSVSEEKETRVIEIVLSSVSAQELLAGKVIGLGALGLTQVGVWLLSTFALSGGAGALLAGVAIALSPKAFLLAAVYFVLGYVVFAIIMATAGALGTNMRESQQVAGIFSFIAFIPYMLGGFMFANPNALVPRVLSFFPLTAPTMMMIRLPLAEVPVEDIVGSIVVLLISIPILVWLGAKIFRMGLLMYGKRPAVGEIVRRLKEA